MRSAPEVPEEEVEQYLDAFDNESIDVKTLFDAYTCPDGDCRTAVDLCLRGVLPRAGFRTRFITELGERIRDERRDELSS